MPECKCRLGLFSVETPRDGREIAQKTEKAQVKKGSFLSFFYPLTNIAALAAA
mgnify:CR=1 FL=1